jgi:hypothetical protein
MSFAVKGVIFAPEEEQRLAVLDDALVDDLAEEDGVVAPVKGVGDAAFHERQAVFEHGCARFSDAEGLSAQAAVLRLCLPREETRHVLLVLG